MAHPMKVHGACHCGSIAFEAVADPDSVTICHCQACQTLTGTAYRVTVAADAKGFRLLRGVPKVYIKLAESGNKRAMVFCGDCGSSVYSHAAEGLPASYGLRVGCLREREALIPRRRIWCESALGWSIHLDGMAQFEKGR
ncbi:GFA family protein [Paucibacter sp. APW11]|uniref:GFA family protein n=1 Tax=Roseateles aquae TaxID=3077235 RepID=A0ABU3PD73_9BURK|nr:GFA family protein [Paucibacter sp. APW11]MDT9000534.1 GFA family protein [Paucibacter sp. APW11]